MKKTRILNCLLILLMMGVATSVTGTKVKHVTFAGGMGQSDNGTHGVKATMGDPFLGKAINFTEEYNMVFGFWNIVGRGYLVSSPEGETPAYQTQLFHNYPNPFNPSTQIHFSLDEESFVRIEIYDLKGRKVDTPFEGVKPAGSHLITYHPVKLASGAYVVLMTTDSFRSAQRMMLTK